jgi:hypothetical protein
MGRARLLSAVVADSEVYDKAKWHYGADNFPSALPEEQGFVHTGMFIAWLVLHEMLDPKWEADTRAEVDLLRHRQSTGPQLFEAIDGVFLSEMLIDRGNAFTRAYFDFDRGGYLEDYRATIGPGLPTLYHVTDSWANYDRLAAVIDRRYAAWIEAGQPSVWKPPRTSWENLSVIGRALVARLRR